MDVATLAMRIDTSDVAKAVADMQRTANAAHQTEQATEEMGNEFVVTGAKAKSSGDSIAGFGRKANASARHLGGYTTGLRQISLQLNQVAQQGAITGDYLSSFAFQLPDILISFGTLGVLAGVAAGAMVPFAQTLWQSGDAAEKTAEGVDGFTSSLDAMDRHLATASTSLADLRDEYGDFAGELRELSTFFAEVEIARSFHALRAEVPLLTETLEEAGQHVETLEAGLQSLGTGFNSAFEAANRELMRMDLEEVERDLGLVGDEILTVRDAFRALNAAETLVEVRDASRDAITAIRGTVDEGTKLPKPLADAVAQLELILGAAARATASLSESKDEARQLASYLEQAANAMPGAKAVAGGRGSVLPTRGDSVMASLGGINVSDLDRHEQALRDARRSGGGGANEAQKEHNKLLREAEKIIKGLRDPMEEYNYNLERLDLLHSTINPKTGELYLSTEQYNRALEDLNETMPTLIGSVKEVSDNIKGELGSAFDAVSNHTKTAGQALLDFANNVLLKVANDLFMNSVGNTISDSLSGILNDVVGRISFGGSSAAAGSATSQAMASTVKGTATSVSSQQSPNVVNVHNYGAEVQTSEGPAGLDIIVKQVTGMVADDIARGGQVASAMQKKFGVRKQLNR